MHARRVEKAVPGLPGAWGWEGALKECQQVTGTPSLWVLACRVESLAELGRARGQEWDEARRALREGWQKAKAEVGGEESREARAYALALVAWKDDNPGEGAGLLLDAFGTDNVPVVLEQAHRKNRRLPQIVTAAVDGLRNGGTLDRPFKSAESAQLAFGWLELAERVAGGERNRDFNRALAAWHRTRPDKKLAGEWAAKWLQAHADAPADERYVLGLVRAGAARAEGPAGRKAALDAYLAALKDGRTLLQKEPSAELSAHGIGNHLAALDLGLALLWEKPEDTNLASQLHAELMAPVAAADSKALLGSNPGKEAKEALAEFLARSGRAILTYSPSWSGIKEPGDPRNTVANWAARTYALAPPGRVSRVASLRKGRAVRSQPRAENEVEGRSQRRAPRGPRLCPVPYGPRPAARTGRNRLRGSDKAIKTSGRGAPGIGPRTGSRNRAGVRLVFPRVG